MSKINIISQQYGELSIKIEEINDAVILFKKKFIIETNKGRNSPHYFSDSEFSAARKLLSEYLELVKGVLGNTDNTISKPQKRSILELNKRIDKQGNSFLSNISDLSGSIENGMPLTSLQFDLLDQVISVLDNQRTAIFKKLRTESE